MAPGQGARGDQLTTLSSVGHLAVGLSICLQFSLSWEDMDRSYE